MADNKVMLKIKSMLEGEPEPTPKQRIPLPDYKNPESRLAYAKAFTEKYGPLVSGRGDTPLRINENPAWGKSSSKALSVETAKKLGLDPEILYASAMEEGMSGLYPHVFKGREKDGLLVQSSGDKEYPISGYMSFGLDRFGETYPGLIKKGYLPADFEGRFKKVPKVNEKLEDVMSADFKSPEDALLAKAATMRISKDEIEDYISKNKVNLSPEAKKFFTLVSYNAGAGNARKMLDEYNKAGYLKSDDFLKKRPSESWKVPYENVMRRIQMARALREEGYFDDYYSQPQQAAANQPSPAQKVMLKVAK